MTCPSFRPFLARGRPLALALALAGAVLALAGAAPAAAAPALLAPVALPELPGALAGWTAGINASGLIVGTSNVARFLHATAWRPAAGRYTAVDLNPPGAYVSRGNAVNAAGIVVGSADSHAEVWRPDIHGDYVPTALRTLLGDADSDSALGIDPWGVVVGQTAAGGVAAHAVIWPPDRHGVYGAPIDLGALPSNPSTSMATAINGTGVIAGGSDNISSQPQAVIWRRGSGASRAITPLASIAGFGKALGIDSGGVVAGLTGRAGTSQPQPAVWRPATGGGYGAPSPLPAIAGGTPMLVRSISPGGVVAGTTFVASSHTHGTVWVPDGHAGYTPVELGTLPHGTESDAAVTLAGLVAGSADTGDLTSHPVMWRLGSR